MGNVKFSDETVKYELRARIDIEGIASEADIVGALFGQTEGLLDQDMELKHLQRTGRIGRIDLKINNKSGNTSGKLSIPSSLNKIETAIIAATLETVDRVGACSCKITLEKIVDVRKDKRDRITQRASEIMKKWDLDNQSDSVDISAIVEKDAKRGRIVQFGFEKLPAGPNIYNSEEIILVEGRADVSNLLKMNIENTIALGGTKVPDTIINLCKSRNVTALLDGDRGGDAILKELLLVTEIDYVARAPKKKEVENLDYKTVKEVLSNRTIVEESEFISDKFSVVDFLKKNNRFKYKSSRNIKSKSKSDIDSSKKPKEGRFRFRRGSKNHYDKKSNDRRPSRDRYSHQRRSKSYPSVPKPVQNIIDETKETTKAVFVDNSLEKLLTVSSADVFNRLQDLEGINSVIIDGVITQRLLDLADQKSVKLVAGAVMGKIERKPKVTQYVTFNRLSRY